MKLYKNVSAMALIGLMAGAAPMAVIAQDQQNSAAEAEVSSGEIDAFVVAFNQVQKIDQEYGAQIQQTTDEDKLLALQEEAQIKKTEAVDQAPDMTVDRYVEIVTLAQTDQDLAAKIMEKLEQ
jgi:hypothetical protein